MWWASVIPTSLFELEHAHHGCTKLIVIETMHKRKHIMAERADAFLALPSEIGTFEEFFEAWTWRHLSYHDKLLEFIDVSVRSQFMGTDQMQLIDAGSDWRALLQRFVTTAEVNGLSALDRI